MVILALGESQSKAPRKISQVIHVTIMASTHADFRHPSKDNTDATHRQMLFDETVS
jgi:hypothetical protein